jgi:hypothetical protein
MERDNVEGMRGVWETLQEAIEKEGEAMERHVVSILKERARSVTLRLRKREELAPRLSRRHARAHSARSARERGLRRACRPSWPPPRRER